MAAAPNLQRHATLDMLRGLAAFAVMAHHFTMRTGEWVLFGSAQIAVDFFFCLGGFVIASSYQERIRGGMTLRGFFGKRVERLYPGFAIGMVIGLSALLLKYHAGLTDYTLPAIAQAAVQNFLYIPFFAHYTVQFFDDKVQGVVFPLNGPAWSLFFGFVGNFVYFYAVRAGRWLTPLLCGLALLGFAVATKIYGESAGWSATSFLGGFPRVIFAVLAGALIYQYRDALQRLPKLPPVLVITAVLGMFAVPGFRLHTYYWFLCAVVVAPLLIALACRTDGTWQSQKMQRAAHYLGALSYPIYCIHVPVFSIISSWFADTAYRTPVVFAGILFCLGAGHLVYLGIEKPLQTMRNARKVRQEP